MAAHTRLDLRHVLLLFIVRFRESRGPFRIANRSRVHLGCNLDSQRPGAITDSPAPIQPKPFLRDGDFTSSGTPHSICDASACSHNGRWARSLAINQRAIRSKGRDRRHAHRQREYAPAHHVRRSRARTEDWGNARSGCHGGAQARSSPPGAVRASAKTRARCSGSQSGVSSRPRPS